MRKFAIILLGAFGLVSCLQEQEELRPASNQPFPEGQPVTVHISVPGFSPATKGLDEGGVLNSLHLAVFGGSGYLKEYVEATAESTTDYTYESTDNDGNPVSHTVPCYNYTVVLAMSESPRTIHFLGNGPSTMPFGYDTAVMPIQLSANGEMGYWQMLYLPDGIRAKRNSDGNYVNSAGEVIPEGGIGYIADEATEEHFRGIPLIRNWSKIVLSAMEGSNFEPISLAVVNVPQRGAMAPYSAESGFIENYQDRGFTYLEDVVHYPGNLPAGTTFDATVPPASAFTAPFGEGVANANGGAVYLYERPAPSDQIPPTFVIIYGHYRNEDDLEHEGDYFYKVDLMETRKVTVNGEEQWNSSYYPIYRNFKYQIKVKKILSQGHMSPAAAAASAGSADVSADVTTSHLADISDGVGRLHISPWMSHTFTREHTEENPVTELSVFFSRTTDGEPDMDDDVRVELLPPEDGGADIIYNLSIGAPYNPEEHDDPDSKLKGWRTVSFCNVAPGRTVRSQTIRITGTHGEGRLYRDVIVTIQPIQPMSVTCSEARIEATKGTEQTISINIPDGLVESMFPLDFTIEAEDMTLTPDNSRSDNNLPVVFGESISEHEGYAGKTAFQYVKTVTWADYFSLPRYEDDEEMVWRRIDCYFKTNRDESGTTVWVVNDYFDKASVSFVNFFNKTFVNLAFTTPIPMESEALIPLYFEMVEDPDGVYPTDYPEILLSVRGLICEEEGISPGPEPGTYIYKPQSHAVTMYFTTTTSDGDLAVDLSAYDYEPGHVEAYHFPFCGFLDGHPLRSGDKWSSSLWSNCAWGHINKDNNKTLLFGYKDHPDKLNTPVTVTIVNKCLTTTSVFPLTPTGPRYSAGDLNYHEIEFRTVGGYADVEISLSSPGYVTETIRRGRFNGNIRTMKVTSGNVFKQGNTYNFTKAHPSFTYSEDNGKVTVSFSSISQETNGSVTLAAGGTYTVNIKSENSNQTLFYVDFIFKIKGSTVYKPESIESSVGTIDRYAGDNRQFVWSIPRGNLTATATFTAPADQDIVLETMYIKSFNGTLYQNGNTLP